MSDKEIIETVIGEWARGSGSVHVQAILIMLKALGRRYRDNATIEGVCDALENMSEDILLLRDELKKQKSYTGR